MFLPIQAPPTTDKIKVSGKIGRIALSQYPTKDAGNAIRCQICCENSVGETDRCKSDDNPNCICLPFS